MPVSSGVACTAAIAPCSRGVKTALCPASTRATSSPEAATAHTRRTTVHARVQPNGLPKKYLLAAAFPSRGAGATAAGGAGITSAGNGAGRAGPAGDGGNTAASALGAPASAPAAPAAAATASSNRTLRPQAGHAAAFCQLAKSNWTAQWGQRSGGVTSAQ